MHEVEDRNALETSGEGLSLTHVQKAHIYM